LITASFTSLLNPPLRFTVTVNSALVPCGTVKTSGVTASVKLGVWSPVVEQATNVNAKTRKRYRVLELFLTLVRIVYSTFLTVMVPFTVALSYAFQHFWTVNV
jgi:hypothetical protein